MANENTFSADQIQAGLTDFANGLGLGEITLGTVEREIRRPTLHRPPSTRTPETVDNGGDGMRYYVQHDTTASELPTKELFKDSKRRKGRKGRKNRKDPKPTLDGPLEVSANPSGNSGKSELPKWFEKMETLSQKTPVISIHAR